MRRFISFLGLFLFLGTGYCLNIPDTTQSKMKMIDNIYVESIKDVLDVNRGIDIGSLFQLPGDMFNLDCMKSGLKDLPNCVNGQIRDAVNGIGGNMNIGNLLSGNGLNFNLDKLNINPGQLFGMLKNSRNITIPAEVENNIRLAETLENEVVNDVLIENNIDPLILQSKDLYITDGKNAYQLNQITNLIDQITRQIGGLLQRGMPSISLNLNLASLPMVQQLYNFIRSATNLKQVLQPILNMLNKNNKSVDQILKRELPRLSDDLREIILKSLPQEIADSNPVQLVDHTYISMRDNEKPAAIIHDVLNEIERGLGLHGSITR